MSSVLSKVERDIVISYISDEKPELLLKSVVDKFVKKENDAEFDDISIKSFEYTVERGVIFIPFNENFNLKMPKNKSRILVFFYYKGRGLVFETVLKYVKNGFALVIDKNIFKQFEDGNGIYENAKCIIFHTRENNGGKIDCQADDNFKIFVPVSKSSILEKFFILNFTNETPSIQNRVLKPIILFLSHTHFLIGCFSDFYTFEIGLSYRVEIVIPQISCERIINCDAKVFDCYTLKDISERKCYEFRFETLKLEDKRFLYEKLIKKTFNS
ncbi:MAG: hypothetical protein ACTTHG_06755 [Treponemataceae bacterium]